MLQDPGLCAYTYTVYIYIYIYIYLYMLSEVSNLFLKYALTHVETRTPDLSINHNIMCRYRVNISKAVGYCRKKILFLSITSWGTISQWSYTWSTYLLGYSTSHFSTMNPCILWEKKWSHPVIRSSEMTILTTIS